MLIALDSIIIEPKTKINTEKKIENNAKRNLSLRCK